MTSNDRGKEATITEHLVELAVRLRRIIIALLIASVVVSALPAEPSLSPYVPLAARLPAMLVEIVVPKTVRSIDGRIFNVTIMPASPFESLDIMMKAAILLGVIGALPVIAREVWAYIEPALYPHEKAFIKRFFALFLLLFAVGVVFGLFLVAPLIMRFMLSLYPYFAPEGYELIIRVSLDEAISFAVGMAVTFGLLFEIPLIIYYLLAYGIVSPSTFEGDALKYAFLAMLVIGAIISPDPSGIGMLVIAVILYIPFYLAVKLGKKSHEKRAKKLHETTTLQA